MGTVLFNWWTIINLTVTCIWLCGTKMNFPELPQNRFIKECMGGYPPIIYHKPKYRILEYQTSWCIFSHIDWVLVYQQSQYSEISRTTLDFLTFHYIWIQIKKLVRHNSCAVSSSKIIKKAFKMFLGGKRKQFTIN